MGERSGDLGGPAFAVGAAGQDQLRREEVSHQLDELSVDVVDAGQRLGTHPAQGAERAAVVVQDREAGVRTDPFGVRVIRVVGIGLRVDDQARGAAQHPDAERLVPRHALPDLEQTLIVHVEVHLLAARDPGDRPVAHRRVPVEIVDDALGGGAEELGTIDVCPRLHATIVTEAGPRAGESDGVAAVDVELLARDEAGPVRGEEAHGLGDVGGVAEASQRDVVAG